MTKKIATLVLSIILVAGTTPTQANDGQVPHGIPHLDHVFVIVMENHGYQQVIGNPDEPYLNSLIAKGEVNLATNYFAIGHPSLTNYLEIVGGSNFGVRSDNDPAWHSTTCTPNIVSGAVNADNFGNNLPKNVTLDSGNVCPISGTGKDALTEAVDNWNEVTPPTFTFLANIDGVKSVAPRNVDGISIADQLVRSGMSWKSYQENLPLNGADGVSYSNGTVSNLDFDANGNSDVPGINKGDVVKAYAAKHNPFVYFRSVQEGWWHNNSLKNVVGFDGVRGLWADLATGDVPSLAFIAPSQCDDQHGRGNGDKFCAFDPGLDPSGLTFGDTTGLNAELIFQGDVTLQRLVKSIKASPAWRDGRNAIVIVWDENDYSGLTNSGPFPRKNQNNVVLTVETNREGGHGVTSGNYYNSFSLLKSLEAGFGLPCLNHACDDGVAVMSDLFGGH
jgi:phosphatidylinositol-3-phosphatase